MMLDKEEEEAWMQIEEEMELLGGHKEIRSLKIEMNRDKTMKQDELQVAQAHCKSNRN